MKTTQNLSPAKCDHEAIRAGHSGNFIGFQTSEWDLLEVYVCPHCGTSIGRIGIGPVRDFDALSEVA